MAEEGYQCSQCWSNGQELIVTTVEDFNAHTAEVHGGESANMEVSELEEKEVPDKEMGLMEEAGVNKKPFVCPFQDRQFQNRDRQ